MTAPSKTLIPVQDYPYVPYNWLAAYGQMARDFGRCAEALSQSTDAMEAAKAEGDFGVRLFGDMMQAYWGLALAPWTALASAMVQQAATAPAPGPVRTRRSGSAES